MLEIQIGARQIRLLLHEAQQILAHVYQLMSGTGNLIEPPCQLLPLRLCSFHKLSIIGFRPLCFITGNNTLQLFWIDVHFAVQMLKKRPLSLSVCGGITIQNLVSNGRSGNVSLTAHQGIAKLGKGALIPLAHKNITTIKKGRK